MSGAGTSILITGCGGYIGVTLASRLMSQGLYDVKISGVDNFIYGQGPLVYENLMQSFRWGSLMVKDVRELTENDVKDYEVIVPLAALVGAPICEKEQLLAREVNLDAIRNLLKITSKQQYIIFPNTNSGYGKANVDVCTEETPLNSLSLYARLKDEAEKAVMDRGNATVFRLATVFGAAPRMRLDLLVNTMVYEAYFNQKISVFDGNFRRNYVGVYDVAYAFCDAIYKRYDKCKDQVFNLGNDACNTTKMGLVEIIKKHLPVVVHESKQTDPDQRDYNVSSKKLEATGWQAYVDLDSGIKDIIAYYSVLSKDRNIREHQTRPMYNRLY